MEESWRVFMIQFEQNMPLTNVTCVWPANALLGEGPLWEPEQSALWWVDIRAPALHRWCLRSGARARWMLPEWIGCLAITDRGDLLLALRSGLHLAKRPRAGRPLSLKLIASFPEPNERLRFNDGKVAPDGSFWVGTMDDEEVEDLGCWYRWTPTSGWQTMVEGFRVTNGPAFDPSRGCVYLTDSARRTIYRSRWQPGTTELELTVFRQLESSHGYPDGMNIDGQGRLWVAFWDGWCVRAFDPESGAIVQEIRLPVPRPTSVIPVHRRPPGLIVTSARIGLTKEELECAPLSGGLFFIEAPEMRTALSIPRVQLPI
ncbi:MAG: SMP-30/gluconolactonase/LRE family protein [Gammaproteobacteria bacterium]|nr:MAG: SMP-30/gluconolactonase/LRE family protein [Gammaproteobacteria bacterium]